MFVVADLLELQDAKPDGNGRTIMSWLILLVNTASTSLYPLYKFWNALSGSGEIDLPFLKDSLSKCFEFFVGSQLAGSLLAMCGCLRKIKDTVDDVKQEVHVDRVCACMRMFVCTWARVCVCVCMSLCL